MLVREVVLYALKATIFHKKSLSITQDGLNEPDKSLAKNLSFGVLRYYHQLNDITNVLLDKPIRTKDLDLHLVLLIGVYQILYTNISQYASVFETVNLADTLKKPWAKPFINAILQKVIKQKTQLLSQPHHSHPSWLIKKIKAAYPQDYADILLHNNQQAPMVLRIHPSIGVAQYQQQLTQRDITATQVNLLPQALLLKQAQMVDKLPNFKQWVYVQDGSAQLAAHLLNPKDGELILDACCAPGGKALHLSELAQNSKIIALDSSQKRLKVFQENLKTRQASNIIVKQGLAEQNDWWDKKLFDKILLDVPCSATGVIRRHPDIKLLRKPKDITQLVKKQADILDNLWRLLKPEGELLYATCSILPQENTQQIERFLSKTPDAKHCLIEVDWGKQQTYGRQQLPIGCFDGFFYAKLQKKLGID